MGYATDSLTQGKFAIKSLGFEAVADGTTDVNDIISGFTGVAYDTEYAFWATAPQIQILQDNGTYSIYYYLTDGYDAVADDGTTAEGWCDSDGNLVSMTITPGTAFWVKVPGADTATTASGAVSSDASVDVAITANKFTLLGNAFPIEITLNGTAFSSSNISGVAYDTEYAFWTTAPQIQILQSNGTYTVYYYLTDGYDAVADDGTTAAGWCDSDGNLVTTATVAVGSGFWLKSPTAMTATFTK